MYKLLLTLRYLRRKLAPLFAAAAVTLCTAMVIIVISVMGGFLEMMRSSVRTLSGDVAVYSPFTGFPRYQEMMEGIKKLDGVEACTPMIQSFGLVNIQKQVKWVEVYGIDPAGLDAVTNYSKTLLWKREDAQAIGPGVLQGKTDFPDYAMKFRPPAEWGAGAKDGIVPGVAVTPGNMRDEEGKYHLDASSVTLPVTVTVMPLTEDGSFNSSGPSTGHFTSVEEFKSGLYEIDSHRVYVPFESLQKMLHMDPYPASDAFGKPTGEMVPGRATQILIRAKEGVSADEVARQVRAYCVEFARAHPDLPPYLYVRTWREQHAMFLDAVEKEKGLLVILFGIISVVAVVMVAVIFYMIVLEKTRDIGVLRALGASSTGVGSIFLGYGLAIGVIGSLAGLALAASIVWNLNGIQDHLFHWFGFKMWDPRVYYFEQIPSQLDPTTVTVICVASVLSSVAGAIIPAFLAGRLDPVEALRYE